MASPNRQHVSISRELDPCPTTHLAGGEGWRDEKMLYIRAFLAPGQLTLAEGIVSSLQPLHAKFATMQTLHRHLQRSATV
jgi:hypothetical protein